ncbi:hypothetical protein ES703_12907 [subsurface metagenome]
MGAVSEDNFLHRLLIEEEPVLDVWRQHIDNCLELASRYNLLDADLEARLKKGDWESWQANINELKVARVLEGFLGVNCLSWHPHGRDTKVGEFEIDSAKPPIFIEVKTIFPRDLESLEEHVKDKLMRYAEQVPIPIFLSVLVESAGASESFSGKKFKAYLTKTLSGLNIEDLKKESIKLPDYLDNATGMHLIIETLPITPEETEKTCHVGMISGGARQILNEIYINHSLYKAYKQLPVGKHPCFVILCSSTGFPIESHAMLNALIGTLAYRVYLRTSSAEKVPESEPFRHPNGFFQATRNRKLSAVGLYKEKLTETSMETNLEIYHNPFATNPIPNLIFVKKGIRQLVKVSDSEMMWVE